MVNLIEKFLAVCCVVALLGAVVVNHPYVFDPWFVDICERVTGGALLTAALAGAIFTIVAVVGL